MKILNTITKVAIVLLGLVANLLFVQPSWADRPNLTQTPEYTEVNQALENLIKGDAQLTPEETQRKIGELRLQQYILETAANWTQVQNQTGKTLAIYGHKGKKIGAPIGQQVYYLANHQTTDDDWNVDAIYLPQGTAVTGLTATDPQVQELSSPVAVQFVSGTQVIAKTNPATDAVEFNITPSKIIAAGESAWNLPELTVAEIETAKPNAPIED